jgi:hypothetical protein
MGYRRAVRHSLEVILLVTEITPMILWEFRKQVSRRKLRNLSGFYLPR